MGIQEFTGNPFGAHRGNQGRPHRSARVVARAKNARDEYSRSAHRWYVLSRPQTGFLGRSQSGQHGGNSAEGRAIRGANSRGRRSENYRGTRQDRLAALRGCAIRARPVDLPARPSLARRTTAYASRLTSGNRTAAARAPTIPTSWFLPCLLISGSGVHQPSFHTFMRRRGMNQASLV